MSDTITGSTIADRYRITGLLRPGRMGDIYVGRRTDDGRRVCIKLLDPTLFDNDEAVKRFERESKVTRRLDHPCSMRVLDFGRSTHGPYLVTEYVEGEVLADVLEENPLEPRRAAHIAGLIASALAAAHREGIVHRDLAPTNVLLGKQAGHDVVKVTDFGLSMLTEGSEDHTESNLTAVGVRIGTPTYMAPEYIEEYELDHRADIYGLGVMLYEMLVGEPPYSGRPYKVMDAHVNAPIPVPSKKAPGVPPWLDELVAALMAKRPDDRPNTADDVVTRIEKGLGQPLHITDYISESAPPAPTRTASPSPQGPPPNDPILVRFIQQNMGKMSRAPAPPPDRSRCFIVQRVATTSIAAEIGVTAGWLLHIPGEDQGLLDPRLYAHVVGRRTYHFYPPDHGERVELVNNGVPLGLDLIRSPENIREHYDPIAPEASALLDLWQMRAWSELEQLSWKTITQQRGPAGILNTGLFAKFLGADKPKLLDHPALLFHGAARIEQGEPDQMVAGMSEVIDFKAKYSSHWPNAYDAVAHFYAARDKLRSGSKELALDLLRQAYILAPLPAIAQLHDEMTGEDPKITNWVGQTFTDYSMDELDSGQNAKLSQVCRGLDSSQLLVICMMGGFRGSIDYNDFMLRYMNIAAFFSDFIAGLHVVTTATKRDGDHPEHYHAEDLARQAGVPFLCLHDYRAFVQRAIKPGRVPTIYVINKFGHCVHEGALSEVDLWEALKLAGQVRVQTLHG